MLGKLLRNDLKRNMKLLCILFLSTIVVSALTRGATELGKTIAFFKIVSIFFDSVFYSLLVNVIVHPFLRGFLNFNKSLYGDESYLTHTLPVTKNDIINSKFLTAIIEMVCAFLCVVASILIKFASPSMISTLKLLLSTIISGNVSVTLTIILFVALVIIEFLMFISIIYFSIIVANKSKEKRVLKTFLITALMSFLALMVLSIILVVLSGYLKQRLKIASVYVLLFYFHNNLDY